MRRARLRITSLFARTACVEYLKVFQNNIQQLSRRKTPALTEQTRIYSLQRRCIETEGKASHELETPILRIRSPVVVRVLLACAKFAKSRERSQNSSRAR